MSTTPSIPLLYRDFQSSGFGSLRVFSACELRPYRVLAAVRPQALPWRPAGNRNKGERVLASECRATLGFLAGVGLLRLAWLSSMKLV